MSRTIRVDADMYAALMELKALQAAPSLSAVIDKLQEFQEHLEAAANDDEANEVAALIEGLNELKQ